ncbi:alcohol dehydrogenase catalytic domain-containing protein [uncultured Modestobacter sp.]|uniref:alcohol dehydrogenase catalytic domain-containing protein n=1 Tax=uncultured Modestobacter sp. TaxID=380048 RepID=UPI00261754EA|nr:alcohol dehydrogenase catalytic domain-containing protein [uncultured Modestobacter sp.]
MRPVTGYAAHGPGQGLRPIEFTRRDLRADDVAVRVTHVGVCHSDLHAVEGMTAGAPPLVPGHEFTGEVTAVGTEVTRFRAGDAVAVGNIVDSCGRCDKLPRSPSALLPRVPGHHLRRARPARR